MEQLRGGLAGGDTVQALQPNTVMEPDLIPHDETMYPRTFLEVAELAGEKGEAILRANIINNVHLVSFEPSRIEVGLGKHAKKELPYQMAKFLSETTSMRWVVTVSNQAGDPPLQQQWDLGKAAECVNAAGHPLVKAVLEAFPGATVEAVRVPEDH